MRGMDLRWFCSDRDEALPQMLTESQLNQLRKEYKKKGSSMFSVSRVGRNRKLSRHEV